MIRLKLLTDEIGARLPQIIQKVRKTLNHRAGATTQDVPQYSCNHITTL